MLNASFSKEIVGSMLIILIGFFLYAAEDLSFSWIGYTWLGINVLATCAYPLSLFRLHLHIYTLYVKRCMKFISLGVMGMSYYNNMLSLPFLLLLMFLPSFQVRDLRVAVT